MRERVAAVQRRVEELLAQGAASWPSVAPTIERITAVLRATPTWPAPDSDAWASLRRQLVEAYDGLVAILPVDATEARPISVQRTTFHVTSALAGLVAALVLFTPPQLPFAAGSLAATAWTLEVLRRRSPWLNDRLMALFGKIARPSEAHRVNSGTWYMTALLLLTLTFSPLLCVVSVAILGFGDPAAALVGRRFGRIRLRDGRTLEGSLAFVVTGTVAALVAMALLDNPLPLGSALPIALVAATTGAIAELFARRVDDNLMIPLSAMAGAWVTLLALGASPW